MEEELIEQLAQKPVLTIEEAKLLLDTICSAVKDKLKITKEDCKKCVETYNEILRLCLKNKINFSGLYNEAVGLDDIPHYYNFIGLNTELGGIWFLVDPTYIQFSCDKYLVEHTGKTFVSPSQYFPKEFRTELEKYSYITYTKEHFYSYINSFVMSINNFNKNAKNIEIEDVIKKAHGNLNFMFFSNIETIQDSEQKTDSNGILLF